MRNRLLFRLNCLIYLLTGHFDGGSRSHLHQVSPANIGELLLDGLEELKGHCQARVRVVVDFRLETDGSVCPALPDWLIEKWSMDDDHDRSVNGDWLVIP